MKLLNKFMFLFLSVLLITFTSCQDEVIEETPTNEQEIIQSESNLASLMRSTAANDGSVDNILDNSDCFTVNLPVTIEANGITLTIETLDDLSLLEAIFDASNTDNDEVEFLFPITIILNDYTEINIDSIDELESFIETCTVDEDIIECANFVYPMSFSIYNTSFQVIETVIIDNDYELYIFLEGLDSGNNGVVLASLDFPVSLQYTNGETVEVNNNQALEEAINVASENCEEINPFDCFEDYSIEACELDITNPVQDAVFNLVAGSVGMVDCDVEFDSSFHITLADAQNGSNAITNPEAYQSVAATVYLRIDSVGGDFQVFEIQLIVEDCSSNCSEEDVDTYLQGCNWKVVNFNGDDHLITYNIDFSSSTEAIITGNGISAVMYWSIQQSAEGVVVEFNNVAAPDIQAITGSWLVVECEEGRLQFEALNSSDTMVMECYYYTVEEMLSVLSECQWEVYSFQVNNVDQTSDYDDVLFSFFESDFALAEVGTSTINYGSLESETGNSDNDLFVLLAMTGETFSLGGYYTVISMTEDEITFYDSQQPRRLILRKTCVSDNQDSDTTQIKDWLNDGNWEVTYATMENVENSEDYDGIVFDFQSDATLLGDNGSWVGELGYEVLRDQEGNLRFVINYLGQFPYWQMDDDWYITEVNSTRIEVHSVNDDSNMEFVLVFEKQ